MMIQSLRTKLVAYGLLALVLVFAALGVYLAFDSRHYLLQLTAGDMREQTLLLGQQFEGLLVRTASDDSLRSFIAAQSQLLGKRITIIDRTGVVRFDSDVRAADLPGLDNHLARPEIIKATADGWGYASRYSRTLKRDLIYLAVPLHARGAVWGYCRLAWPWSSFLKYQRRLLLGIIVALAVAALLLLGLTSAVWGPASRSIKQIKAVAQRIAAGDFQARAGMEEGPRETRMIARSLNAMAESWERAADLLQEKTSQLEAVLNGMSEGVIVIDADHRVKLINPAAATMTGVPRDQATGKLLLELIRQPQIEALITGSSAREEIEIDGRALLLQVSPLAQRSPGQVLVLSDITDLRRLEAVRRDFVANVSHELKTPLSAVVGFTEALRDGAKDDPAQRDDFLERIRRQSSRMAAIVDDLLVLTGMESRGAQPDLRPVLVRVLVDKALDAISQRVRDKGIQLAVPPDPALEQTIPADEDKMVQALVNLLDNAVKYSPGGSTVSISAVIEGDSVKLSISDDGPGISAGHLPRLFERFYRVDKSRSRELGGTGLGLAIVKHIVELHGGKAGVTSIEGKGSTFWVLLPT